MINDDPFFSIVIPIYNTEKYLNDLIESIKVQTYNNWELILVDDGSTDSSGEICDQYANGSKIFSFHTENCGGIAARYYGIGKSKGKYILVVDSDDKLMTNCLKTVKETIDKTNCDVVIFGFRTIGNESKEYNLPLQKGREYKREEIINAIAKYEYYALWNKVIRGDIVRKNCLCNLRNISMNHDVAMIFPFLLHINKGIVLNDILYEYRIIEASVSHNITCKKVIDAGHTIGFAVDILKESGLFTDEIRFSIFRTYAKQISSMFDLIINGDNQVEDFKNIRDQKVYKEFAIFEKEGDLGVKRKAGLYLFRKKYDRLLNIILRIKRKTL